MVASCPVNKTNRSGLNGSEDFHIAVLRVIKE